MCILFILIIYKYLENPPLLIRLAFGLQMGGAIGNLIGLPGISIPNGFDKNGLPTSFQIMGNIQSDRLIIKCAQLIQNETDWHNKHPN